ncbi:hypothetical protein LEP3755_33950 [Leptolyngbya sp. NIES-3755]|nr:hypothetical protein LEP3755_33950 [Leptolyngbya sp. NIES-3755]
MPITRDLNTEYRPARIFNASVPNANHIPETGFSDRELGQPELPSTIRRPIKTWMPITETLGLLFAAVIFQNTPSLFDLIRLGFPIIWIWALLKKHPEYEREKVRAEQEHQEAVRAKRHYDEVTLPTWIKHTKPQALLQKRQEWALHNLNIEKACRLKGWRIHTEDEVEETRRNGYIGRGEEEVVRAIKKTGLQVSHQVQIESFYTADILCFNPDSGKLCIVEIDGAHHCYEDRQIYLDNGRMESLSNRGVPTIRFINSFAQRNSTTCAEFICKFLSNHSEESH